MTRREAINDFIKSNSQMKKRLETDKMRMDTEEIKKSKYYIERNKIAIRALEIMDIMVFALNVMD